MFSTYKFKIQWLFKYDDAIKIMLILGPASFDKICIRDYDLKIIDTYKVNLYFANNIMQFLDKYKYNGFYIELIRK